MKFLSSSVRQPCSQAVLGSAPVIDVCGPVVKPTSFKRAEIRKGRSEILGPCRTHNRLRANRPTAGASDTEGLPLAIQPRRDARNCNLRTEFFGLDEGARRQLL